MNDNKLPNVPFNIFTATEDEIDKEAGKRAREKQRVEQELKRFRQHYSDESAHRCPKDAIDSTIEYAKLKAYYDELNTSIIYQEMLITRLKELEPDAETLSGFDILQQIENVLRLRVPCPDWLYKQFNRRFACVATGKAIGFGDEKSFGKFDKKNRADKIRDYSGESLSIFVEIQKRLNEGGMISGNNEDDSVFQIVADECDFGLSASSLKEIYYKIKRDFEFMSTLINRLGERK